MPKLLKNDYADKITVSQIAGKTHYRLLFDSQVMPLCHKDPHEDTIVCGEFSKVDCPVCLYLLLGETNLCADDNTVVN